MKNSIPKYQQIHASLRNDIMNHIYEENAAFPTEKELMETYGASRTTIRNALESLRKDGLIESRRGIGTIVTTPKQPEIPQSERMTDIVGAMFHYTMADPGEETATEPLVDIVPVAAATAAALGIPVGTEVYRIRWLLSVGGVACCYMINFLPMNLTPDLDKRIRPQFPLYPFLLEEYGLEFTSATDEVKPVAANFMEARFLDVEEGKPLYKIMHTAYRGKDPLEYSITIANPDIFQLTLDIRRKE